MASTGIRAPLPAVLFTNKVVEAIVERDPPKRRLAMAFVLGVIVFVVIIGVLDARLPWPDPRSKEE
jgi:hypothetical protein